MSLKTSFFNKGLFFSNLKRFAWAAVLETIILFLSMPLLLMMEGQWSDLRDVMRHSGYTIFPNLTFCVYPVVLAVLLFNYLHKPKMTTALHGLPVSRNQLFFSTVLAGAALIAIPIVLNTVLVGVVNVTMDIGRNIYMTSVLRWAVYGLLLCLVLFAFTTFIGMFVGNPAGQFVFTYIMHFLPLALFAIFMALCQLFFYGFDSSFDIPQWMLELPMMTVAHVFVKPCWYYMLLFALLSVVFFALALVTYKKRPLEQAGDIVVFDWLKPVFKYGVSLCLAAVGFLYIAGIANIEAETNLVGNTLVAVLWAAVGFSIAQMLILKTWRIFGAYKEMLGVCLTVAVIFVAFQCDMFGFEMRLPMPEEVESVQVGYISELPEGAVTLREPENIKIVTQLHEKALQARSEHNYADYLRFTYKLKNGTTLKRAYQINGSQLLLDLYNADETLRAGYPMLYADAERIRSISCDTLNKDRVYYVNDRDALLAAMRKDVENRVIAPWWPQVNVPETEITNAEPKVEATEMSGPTYYLEFEMYMNEQQLADRERYYNYNGSGIMYYNVRIEADEMPETYKLLQELELL